MQLERESIVCPGCACLCDDLDLVMEDHRPVAVHNVCAWGTGKFLGEKKLHHHKERRRLTEPQIQRQGGWESVSYEAALEEAASLLAKARRPVIYGLTNSGSWTQRAALVLARSLRARLEPADLAFMAPYYQALQKYGLFWATLETLRDEADAVIYWGANPLHSCPRQLVRYAVFARGRFTERGIEDRQVAAVDLYRTEMAHFCHFFVQIEPDKELPLVEVLIAAVKGGLQPESLPSPAKKLTEFLARATYGVIFCGRGVSYRSGQNLFDRLGELAACLNQTRPFVLFPMSGDFNAAGLYHLLLTETGSPFAPDFAASSPLGCHAVPVDFQEVDALLVSGADLFWFLKEEQAQDLIRRQVPIVALSPFADRTTARARVLLPVALDGIETPEIAHRMDGLPVFLRPVAPAPAPPAHQVLADLNLFF
uniref:Molybdopterin oxidoreductase domain-containing protein n=1 Tax=Desulfobacca acetoxidans TaxID=60893 RepID=A0A7C3SID4_9BACT